MKTGDGNPSQKLWGSVSPRGYYNISEHTENEANKSSFRKCIVCRCDYSHVGMALRLLLSRYTILNAIKDEKDEKQNARLIVTFT